MVTQSATEYEIRQEHILGPSEEHAPRVELIPMGMAKLGAVPIFLLRYNYLPPPHFLRVRDLSNHGDSGSVSRATGPAVPSWEENP